MKKIGVIGLGNPLRRDDGIGILLLEWVRTQKKYEKKIECIDGGTGGMAVLHVLARFDVVLIIDAVDFRGHPGEVRLFSLRDIQTLNTPGRLSTHDVDFLQVLRLSQELHELPSNLTIFGIQPYDVSPGPGLSKVLLSALGDINKKLSEALETLLSP
jgi:hydrogenase maturation protease